MFLDVEIKIKNKNKLLFSHNSECLIELKNLMKKQNHRTLVMWALDCAKLTLIEFENKYPNEKRPRICLNLCENWAKGKIKMPIAKKAILDAHIVAKEMDDIEYGSLCHAIGHAGATIHVKTHAIGLPIYELTSIVLKCNKVNYSKSVIDKINYYYDTLLYWEENIDNINNEWATFL